MSLEENVPSEEAENDVAQEDPPSFIDLQRERYTLGGKGGDGDPPYAKDMGKPKKGGGLMEQGSDGSYRYRRSGD